ncbi:MAG: phosphoglucosamine mutase [Planctomycetota bacterium]
MPLFGTDGIRGRAGEAPLEPLTLLRIAQVLGRLLSGELEDRSSGSVLIAHDGRASSDMIQSALAAGLLSEGFDTAFGGLMTTPALAHETRLGGHAAGVMISASHNPAADNGIKIFGSDGSKLPDALETRIEAGLSGSPAHPGAPTDPGRAVSSEEAGGLYEGFLRGGAFSGLDLEGTRLLVDCANGAGSTIVPRILRDLGAEVRAVNDAPDGRNINEDCGALHPEGIAHEVPAGGYNLGFCLDGDGDRSIFIDESGQVVRGDALLTLFALDLDRQGRLEGRGIVVTVMSNLGMRKALGGHDIRVIETQVGDRAVVAAMKAEGIGLGGEPSGHLIFGHEHNYTGDGLYTCLKLLAVMRDTGRNLSDLASCFTAYPQLLVNVPIGPERPELAEVPEIAEACSEVERQLGDEGRVVLRYSGTENLCRVMIEGPDEARVRGLVELLVQAVGRALVS